MLDHARDAPAAGKMKYAGCIEINTSMRSLDFDTRSLIAKECINRINEASASGKSTGRRAPKTRISRMLADAPNMNHAGESVDLTITSSFLNLTTLNGQVIAKHDMPNISFAWGGDAEETRNFVAYVAKDQRGIRACFVLECLAGPSFAQDVITSIGQAFEMRFKEFLRRAPKSISERIDTVSHVGNGSLVADSANGSGGDPDRGRVYYNDLPDKLPPEIPRTTSLSPKPLAQPQAAPRAGASPKKFNDASFKPDTSNLIDLETYIPCSRGGPEISSQSPTQSYTNCPCDDELEKTSNSTSPSSVKDPFDMVPFDGILEQGSSEDIERRELLANENWYHGPISRKDSEALVVNDGDFLVRESQGSSGQYVLTGMQGGVRKHLLLVDPEGVVRTKDKTFESVSHLINYHRNNALPIISAESALLLQTPVHVNVSDS